MIYLLLAIASSALTSVVIRGGEKYVRNQMAMFLANYAVCIVLSLFFAGKGAPLPEGRAAATLILVGVLSGVLYLSAFVLLKFNMRHNGIVLASTFMKLGVLVPTAMAVLVFHEAPTWLQLGGIVLAVIAIVIIHFEKDAVSAGGKKVWLLVLLVLGGFCDSMANVFDQVCDPAGKDWYLLLTFGTAFVLSGALMFREPNRAGLKDLLVGTMIGLPNYFSSKFLLLALGSVDAVIAYPTFSAGTLVVITIAGVLAFRETVSRKKAAALGLILLALCLLNL